MESTLFGDAVQSMRSLGFNPYPKPLHIQIPDARDRLMEGLRYYLGDKAVWNTAYDDIAEWLADNQSRGLLCVGNCGLGKTLICCNIIPVLINHFCHYVVSTYDTQTMNANIDEVRSRGIICIDDIGTESEAVRYGERRLAFPEIVDEAEKCGKLLIATSNLKITGSADSVEAKYGLRTLDRLRAITRLVVFKGKSYRG